MANHIIEFPIIKLDRGISEVTGKIIIDEGPIFFFTDDIGDTILHQRFIQKYKKQHETNKTNPS